VSPIAALIGSGWAARPVINTGLQPGDSSATTTSRFNGFIAVSSDKPLKRLAYREHLVHRPEGRC